MERHDFAGDEVEQPKAEEVPTTPFKIVKAAERDDMKDFRETARWMDLGDAVEELTAQQASKLAKAIVEKYGPRTATIQSADGKKRVIRVAERPVVVRKPKLKKPTEGKQKAAK